MTINTAPVFYTARQGTGKAIIDITGNDWSSGDFGRAMAVQSDGKILVAGFSCSNESYADYDFSVIRLNADGTLDTTFSYDGKAIFDLSDENNDECNSMTVQADGKILLAGYANRGESFAVIRLNTDGTLDTTFSDDGKAFFDFDFAGEYSFSDAKSITVQADGKILVAGDSSIWNGSSYDNKFSVIRLNTDGSLDTTFSGDGRVLVEIGTFSNSAKSLTLQTDGKILIAGNSDSLGTTGQDYSLMRLNTDGSLDTSFSSDGMVTFDLGGLDYGNSVTMQSDGKILVAGGSNIGNLSLDLIRLNTDGTLDTSFSGDGKVALGVIGGTNPSVTVQSDGKILVAGTGYANMTDYYSSFSVVRLNTDGTLDTSFSGDGIATFDVGSCDDQAYSLSVLADGKILIAGQSASTNSNWELTDFSVIRLNADGTLDTTFGQSSTLGGTVSYTEGAAAIALDTSVAVYDAELGALNGGAGNYSGASVTISRQEGASSQDVFSGKGNLVLSGSSAVLSGVTVGTLSNAGGTLSIIFNANATQARVNETLSSIGYANNSDAPSSSAQISWLFSDGSGADALSVVGSTTVTITAVNDAPTGTVAITGSAVQGLTLTANTSTLADADGLDRLNYYGEDNFSYQWLRNGTAITGANASTYKLVQADTGAAVSVRVSYFDNGNTLETITSGTVVPYVSTQPSAGDDLLTGTSGNDTLNGGAGADTMTGGDGSDTYYVDNTGDVVSETNTVASTGGTDRVYSYLSAYTLGANIENGRILASGTASLTGNGLNNTLYAGAGSNVLDGLLGTDTVSYQYATAAVTVSLDSTAAQATGGSGSDTLLNVENLTGSSYADKLTGSAGSNTLNGGAGADTMTGGDGSDIYYVDNNLDVVSETNATASTGGTDVVYSALSAYTLGVNVENGRIDTTATASLTGNGLNNMLYAGAGDNVFDGLLGTDTVTYQNATAAVTVSLDSTAAQATGGSGSDTLLNVENLMGSSYADSFTGSTNNNVLNGAAGNDILSGGAGNDTLIGGLGADKLTGGTGADRFDFNALAELGLTSTTWDTIEDFKTSEADKIDLLGVDANTALTGDQAFSFLGSLAAFSGDATGQLRFDTTAHILYGSTDADTDAEFAIALAGVSSLSAADFVL